MPPNSEKPLNCLCRIPLYRLESVFVFSLAVLLMAPKAVTEVLRSGNSFACPSQQNKNTIQLPKGLSMRPYQSSLAYFEVFGHWNEMTLLSKRLASFSWCVPNSSSERIPIWCNFPATTQRLYFLLLPTPHASPAPPPPCRPAPSLRLPILFRLKENLRETGHNGGRWKSTVFSFYLSFLCLIFRFLVVLISAICNSYI